MAVGGREVAGVERVGYELECHGAVGQRRRLIHQLFAAGILDPELAEIGADAVDRAFEEPCALAVAGFVHGEFDGRRTAIENQNRQRGHI